MRNILIVDENNCGCYGALLQEHFKKRFDLFAGTLEWDIPRGRVSERDQYDRAETVYVLVEEGGQVTGYARLLPTTARVSYGRAEFSYLVRDAALGLLPGIPSDLLAGASPPSSEEVWEMTRVEAMNRKSLEALFYAANQYLVSEGASSAVTFTRSSFASILNRLQFPTEILGPEVTYGGKKYCALQTNLNAAHPSIAAPTGRRSRAEQLRPELA